MDNATLPVVVIGAGIGGLSAAIRLAAAGQRVIILEKNQHPGGKMGEIRAQGFRWDTGPSVITMRHVFEDLFVSAGRRMEDYLDLLPVEPITRYFYPDGHCLDASRELPKMTQQIAALHERDVEGYLSFLAYAARLHRLAGLVFIYDDPPSLRSFFKISPLDYFRMDPIRTMHTAIGRFVHSPRLQQLLSRFATYFGASPYLAPATLNVIAHVEMTDGVWYPRGGIYAIARAYTRLAQELGVEIRTGCSVEQIRVKDGSVCGVRLKTGGVSLGSAEHSPAHEVQLAARAVVANLDVASVYHDLLPAGTIAAGKIRRLTQAELSCSGFILLLGIRGQHPELAHHNIFFSSNYRAEFDHIFRQGVPPAEPTIYLAVTSKTDPDHAPAGCENWFVLVNVPSLGPQFDWKSQAVAYRDRVLARLAAFGLDVREQIVYERLLTPIDLEQMTGAWRGSLYGAFSNRRLAVFLRPHNRSADVRGLYFCGGTTHPGGGVPMVTLSGKVTARMILRDSLVSANCQAKGLE